MGVGGGEVYPSTCLAQDRLPRLPTAQTAQICYNLWVDSITERLKILLSETVVFVLGNVIAGAQLKYQLLISSRVEMNDIKSIILNGTKTALPATLFLKQHTYMFAAHEQ